eukprot:TRINITY_DN9338_c0_g1_i1.p1 TRINITY_DN9338_c0_g1~~TRINITY_DN9338_c0_g1_i1.p1  ORF type:complete len:437 (-),score=52.24 TRINITY_DN9338_c0_g1_i1:28-1299(-)
MSLSSLMSDLSLVDQIEPIKSFKEYTSAHQKQKMDFGNNFPFRWDVDKLAHGCLDFNLDLWAIIFKIILKEKYQDYETSKEHFLLPPENIQYISKSFFNLYWDSINIIEIYNDKAPLNLFVSCCSNIYELKTCGSMIPEVIDNFLHLLENVKKLFVSDLSSLKFLKYFPNVTHLSCFALNVDNLDDIAHAKKLTNLKLKFLQTRDGNVRALDHLENLETLVLNTEFANFEELSFEKLDRLKVVDVGGINSINCLKNVSDTLEYLHISSVSDFNDLAPLYNLKKLNVSCTSFDDTTMLSNLTKLKSLECCFTNIAELDGLEHLINLEKLDISCTSITSLETIVDLPIISLDITSTMVTDLSCLRYMQIQDLTMSSFIRNEQGVIAGVNFEELVKMKCLINLTLYGNVEVEDKRILESVPYVNYM